MKGPRSRNSLMVLFVAAILVTSFACIPQASAIVPAGRAAPGSVSSGQGQVAGQSTGITVQGQGSVSVTPDLAEIWLGVNAKAPTVAEAQADASTRMSQVMDRLISSGISKDQITTIRYTIFPQYGQNGTPTGYAVDNIVSAKTKAIDKVGQLLDAVVVAGANRVERVSFTVADQKPLASRARDAAMADAKAKADQLARLGGVSLGQPLSIMETASGTPPMPFGLGGDIASAAVAPPISTGEMEIQVSVQVTYAIQ